MRTPVIPSGIDYRAYFIGCALNGYLANPEEKPCLGDSLSVREGQAEHIACFCVDLGNRVYELYREEDDDDPPEDPVSKFNKRVGL